ncbi:MAG: hypothetical protein IKY48_03890 [Bacteroidales bacterium]|nr:hypothetical protein [Bacteroidales bacterium]
MKKVLFALMALLAFAACKPEAYDDTAIKEQINNLDDRLTKVEEDLATLELNVAAMKTLAEALKTGKYIVSYTALADESGYTITFSDGTSVVVKHGEKGDKGDKGDTGETGATGAAGKDGVTPTVTVKDVDGVLYWFINGEQICPVYEGTPVFSSVDGNLYVTYPGETEPVWIGALTGKSIFDSVVVDEEAGVVIFTFVGENGQPGDSFALPLAAKFELVINTTVGLEAGATSVEIPYEVKGANSTTVVDVLAVACEAVVEPKVIKVSNIAAGAQLLVFADNGEGKTSIKKVVFSGESYSVEEVSEVIPAEGGSVVVKGVSNVPFEVVIPAEAAWLTLAQTKSAFELTFVAEANTLQEVREAEVSFVRQGTEEVLMSVTIAQEAAKPFAEKVWSIAAVFGGGADRNMTMDSEYVYVAQAAGGNGAIKAISIADPTQVKDVKVATKVSVSTNGTHAISCVRMMPNTDPAVNGGKDVLVASNLTTGDGTARLTVYVWTNGIDADPNYFVIDSGTRRLGDKFTVKGTYQAGELWFWDYGRKDNAAIRIAMNDGVAGLWGTPELAYATGRFSVPVDEGGATIGEVVAHPGASYDGDGNPTALLATSNVSYGFVNQSAGNAYAISAWGTEPKLAQSWGYDFFEHNGKNYIAYVQIPTDRNNAVLNIIEDINGAADFQGTLEAKAGLVTFDLLDTPMANGTAGHGVGDCATAVVDGVRYIAIQGQNMGVALYRLN